MVKVSIEELGAFLKQRTPRSIPRNIRKRALRNMGLGGIIAGLVFGGMGSMFAYIFIPWKLPYDIRLSVSSVDAKGTVLARVKTNMSENESKVYKYHFSFTAEDGQQYQGTCYKTSSRMKEGAKVKVEYLADDPKVSRIHKCRLSPCGWGAGFVIIFPLIGFGIIIGIFVSRARRIAMLKYGVFSTGTIKSISVVGESESETCYKVKVKFDDTRGKTHIGSYTASGYESYVAKDKFEDKETIGLLYRINNPKRIFLVDALVSARQ